MGTQEVTREEGRRGGGEEGGRGEGGGGGKGLLGEYSSWGLDILRRHFSQLLFSQFLASGKRARCKTLL